MGATVCTNKAATTSVLVFSEDAEQLGSWVQELSSAGVRVATAASPVDARHRLATEGLALAVLDACVRTHSDEPVSRWTFFSCGRPKIIWVTRDFSSLTVLALSEDGDLVLPHPLVRGTLLRAVEMRARSTDEVSSFAKLYRLSLRETAVLRHALAGLNNDEAADALGCSPRTVSSFWNRIFRKTNVSGQRDVIIRFLQSSRGSSRSGTFLVRTMGPAFTRSTRRLKPLRSRTGAGNSRYSIPAHPHTHIKTSFHGLSAVLAI